MNATRRLRYAAVPAAFAMIALAGCQDEAPTTSAPTAAPTAAASSQAPWPAPTGEAPSAPASSAPASSAAPAAPSTSAAAPANPSDYKGPKCDSTSGSSQFLAGLATKPVGTAQTADKLGYSKNTSVEVTLGKPKVDSTSKTSFFPGDGMVAISYPVTIKLKLGSYYISSRSNFAMSDPGDNPCEADILGEVVPKSKQVQIESLKPGDSTSGTLTFAVPKGADYTKFHVMFNENGGGKAQLAWDGS